MKKRSLAFFLCVALLCALWVPLIPAASAADITDSGTCGENLTWTLDSEGVLTISGTGEMEDYSWKNPAPWGTEIKAVVIENGVTSIGVLAFGECSDLTNVTLSESVTRIGVWSFYHCSALRNIIIPKSVTNIDKNAFFYCANLTRVGFMGNAPEIGASAFQTQAETDASIIFNTRGLILFYIDGNQGWTTPTFGVDQYRTATWNGATLPASGLSFDVTWMLDLDGTLTIFGEGWMGSYFEGDSIPWGTEVKSVVIENGVKGIGTGAFAGCSALKGITIPESATYIGDNTFFGCSALASIVIPERVTSIGYKAFSGCSALASITIPKSVTYIERYAFENCSGLNGIRVDKDNTAYSSDQRGFLYDKEKTELLFVPTKDITSFTVPASVTFIDLEAIENCTDLSAIWVDEKNTAYSSDTVGVLYNKEKTRLLYMPLKAELGDYVIPDGVTGIEYATFKGRTDLTAITIPGSVASIDISAFEDCTNLTSVIISKGVTSIGAQAFWGCSSLTDITIPEGITCIELSTFVDCTALTNIVLPESLTRIEECAFSRCDALASVCFKENAPEIGEGAFATYDEINGERIDVIPGLTLYYIEGKEGWTTPTWRGYPTATWDGVNVPKGHEHDYKATVTAPTCTEKGYTTYVCSCGSSYVANEVAALGHAWDEGKITTAPTTEKEGVKTFTCTRCNTTKTEPIDKLQATVSFKDVDEKAYYAAAVEWAVAKNITKGTAADTFAPNDTCTRGQIVTFLWRAAGEPKPSGTETPFTDVKQSDYWYNAVLWAVEQGITTGTSATTFSPNEGCTRGQVATFLWRYENKPTPAAKNPFKDVKKGAYYYDAVLWAVEADVTKGTGATTFAPNDTCTRGQIVTFLYRDIA